MTTDNGSPFGHDGIPVFPAAEADGFGQGGRHSAFTPGGTPVPGTGSRLPARDITPDRPTSNVLDPAFLTGLANSLYAEDRLSVPAGPAEAGADLPDVAGVGRGVVPGSANLPGTSAGFDFHDPRRLLAVFQELRPTVAPESVPAGTPESPAVESYYFLTRPAVLSGTPKTPATPALSAPATPATPAVSSRLFDVESIRRDFPILHQRVHGKPLIWLDNAATTQKPRQVIDAVSRFYERDNSNIHRAAHTLAARSTDRYEGARDTVRRFLGASSTDEIVFVRGATEAINLVAQTFGRKFIGAGDEIVVTEIEHHANIVPWQQLAAETGAVLRVAPVNDRGEVLLEEFERLLGGRTKLAAFTQVSNALGTVLPVRTMTQLAKRHGAAVLVDGSQSAPHMPVDVQAIGCDFFALAGHKLFAPTGIGVLYGRKELLEAMPPWQGGGNMIDQVSFEGTTYQPPPAKFEAGTGILAGAVGLAAAIEYLDELGMENINRYEHELLAHAMTGLAEVPGLRLIGTAGDKASVASFVLDGSRNEDVGRYLDREGIAVRAGHHCAQPTMRRFGVTGTVRPSLAFYNTIGEIDVLVEALKRFRHLG